jgi:hypothetical protein
MAGLALSVTGAAAGVAAATLVAARAPGARISRVSPVLEGEERTQPRARARALTRMPQARAWRSRSMARG